MDKISTNNLLLPSVPQRSKDGVIVMKLSNANMIRLRSASFMRESGSMQLFKHDFTGWSSVYYVRNNHKLMHNFLLVFQNKFNSDIRHELF